MQDPGAPTSAPRRRDSEKNRSGRSCETLFPFKAEEPITAPREGPGPRSQRPDHRGGGGALGNASEGSGSGSSTPGMQERLPRPEGQCTSELGHSWDWIHSASLSVFSKYSFSVESWWICSGPTTHPACSSAGYSGQSCALMGVRCSGLGSSGVCSPVSFFLTM